MTCDAWEMIVGGVAVFFMFSGIGVAVWLISR